MKPLDKRLAESTVEGSGLTHLFPLSILGNTNNGARDIMYLLKGCEVKHTVFPMQYACLKKLPLNRIKL